MYPKFKTNLIGLAVALGFVVVGFGLGEPPRSEFIAQAAPSALLQVAKAEIGTQAPARVARRGALKRNLAMPYVSFAALTPRQES
jgi:hypothetical protein